MAKQESRRRLDVYLVDEGLVRSREEAKRLILAGKVLVDDRVVDKAGSSLDGQAVVRVKEPDHPYVSRGGVKLAGMLELFDISVSGKVALDVGASTGGFTDVLLRSGAEKVYAVDVGYGQLDYRLRQDPRVVVMEKTNARYLNRDDFPDQPRIVTMDVSFISVLKVLGAVHEVTADQVDVLVLAKPQFEVGKHRVGKGGVVRRKEDHLSVLQELKREFPGLGFTPVNVAPSPIQGPKGNREFWFHLRKEGEPVDDQRIAAAVEAAHQG